MAQLWTTGPALVYCGVGPGYAPVFLGTAESKPNIEVDHEEKPVQNDLGGSAPFDTSYQGNEGWVRMDLGRWNEPVLAAITSVPNAAGLRGITFVADSGALTVTEGLRYPLWIQFPNSLKTAYAGMPGGYRFARALIKSESFSVGSDVRKVSLVWHCVRLFDPILYAFILYDGLMVGLPTPN